MKKILAVLVLGIVCAFFAFGGATSISNPGYPYTNSVYAAKAGYAEAAGTSVVATATEALLVTETNRAYIAETNLSARLVAETNRANIVETNLSAQLISETNRAYIAETNLSARLVTETNRAYVVETNLTALLVTETNRAQVAENVINTNFAYKLAVLFTNTYVTGITTDGVGAVTGFTTTNRVFYLPR